MNPDKVNVFTMKQIDLHPVTAGHLKRERGRDTLLSKVFKYVQSGWPKTVEDMLLVCFDKCHELTTEQGCLMWGTRVVIPKVHQQKVQEEPKLTSLDPWEFPDGLWRRIHVDFGGPFQGKSFLVIVNAYSKWRLWQWMKPPQTGQWMICVPSLPVGNTAANGNR